MEQYIDLPKGFKEIKNVDGVFISVHDDLVVTGTPNEDGDHNCDDMGYSSIGHVIFRSNIGSRKCGW